MDFRKYRLRISDRPCRPVEQSSDVRQWQCHRSPHPAQYRAAGQMFLGNEMHTVSLSRCYCAWAVCVLCAIASFAGVRFWNWSLLTIRITIVENR